MRLYAMVCTLFAGAMVSVVVVTKIAHPCGGDLTGTSPVAEHRGDLQREALSARADAARAEALAGCGTNAECITNANERFMRYEADALGAAAMDQRDALRAECMRNLI